MNESKILQSLFDELVSTDNSSDFEFVSEFESYEEKMGLSRKKKDLVLSTQDYNDFICCKAINLK